MIDDWEKRLRARAEGAAFRPRCSRFYFLRHGQTEHNRQGICQGQTDVPLNETGLGQAAVAAAVLAEVKPVTITASDLKRVRQTAKPIAERLGLEITSDANLRERSFGVFEDRPVEGRLWAIDHVSVETIEDFVDRSLKGFGSALTEDDTLVVTHGGLRRVLAGALGLDMNHWTGHNALPMRFTREGSRWRAEALTKAGAWPVDGPAPDDLDR